MHVSFGGCGFLLAFHIGVAKQLQKFGHLTHASSVAGASGGALVAAALACDVSLDAVEERLRQSARTMRSPLRHQSLRDDVRGHILELFPSPLPSHLPLTVATTQVWPRPGVDLHTTFRSRDELANVLLASCHIPFYLSRDAVVRHQDAWHLDGCVVSLVPRLPHHVGVNVFPLPFANPKSCISPSLIQTGFPFSLRQLLVWSLLPPHPDVLDELMHWGQVAAAAYVERKETRAIN